MKLSRLKKGLKIVQVLLFSVTLLIPIAFGGTGSIRIDPAMPEVTVSPATFSIWVQGGSIAYHPQILMVMTDACHDSLSSIIDVTVDWDGGSGAVSYGMWTSENDNSKKIPPPPVETTSGTGYTVASLKSHLYTTDQIWWAMIPILEGPLTATEQDQVYITITLPASSPHMMIYILGKSTDGTPFDMPFDMRIPPTIPGLMVPEIPFGTIAVLGSMIMALIIYVKRPSINYF